MVLPKKYGGICWLDCENGYCICEAHPDWVFFQKKHGNNKYMIWATYQGFDLEKNPEDQLDKFDRWEKDDYSY